MPPPAKPLTLKFEPARWRGGPPICVKASKGAHVSEKAALSFFKNVLPRFSLDKLWKCEHCGWWHLNATAPPPSGESSGKKRPR